MAYTSENQTMRGAEEGSRAQQILRETEIRDNALERKSRRSMRVGQLILGLALFGFWEFGSGVIMDQFFVSKPSHIAISLWGMLTKEELLYHMQFTVVEALTGYALGASAGLLLGFLLARIDLVYRVVQPFIIGFYGIPRIALAPLFILWFGIGISSKIAVAAVMTFFIVLINTIAGIRSVAGQLLQVAKVMGASEWDLNWKVIFPSSTPFIIAGLQIAAPQAMIGAIVGEFISSNRGVGHLINRASGWLDTPGLFAGIFALMVVVLLMNYGVTVIGNRLMRWNPKYDSMREPV